MKVQFKKHNIDPASSKGLKVEYGPGKRKFPKVRWILILLLATSPIHYFVITTAYNALKVQADAILETELKAIHPLMDGVADTLLVKNGAKVDSGDILMLIRPLANPEQKLALPDTFLMSLEERPVSRELNGVARKIVLARRELALAKEHENNLNWLLQQGAATEAEIQTAKLRTLQSESQVEGLLIQQNTLHGQLADLRANRNYRPVDTSDVMKVLRSPIKGTIRSMVAESGRPVRKDDRLLLIEKLPLRSSVRAYLDPQDLEYVIPGKPVDIEFPDGKVLKGAISHVIAQMDSSKSDAITALLRGNQHLDIQVDLVDTLPKGMEIRGLPLKIRFWRYW